MLTQIDQFSAPAVQRLILAATLIARVAPVALCFMLIDAMSAAGQTCRTTGTQGNIPLEGEVGALVILAEFSDGHDATDNCTGGTGTDPWPTGATDVPDWAFDLIRSSYVASANESDSSLTAFFGLMSGGDHELTGVVYPDVVQLESIVDFNAAEGLFTANEAVIDSVDSDDSFAINASELDLHPTTADGLLDFVFILYRSTRNTSGIYLQNPNGLQLIDGAESALPFDGSTTFPLGSLDVADDQGTYLFPAVNRRDFWGFVELMAHEYAHDLLHNLAGVINHLEPMGRYDLMQGNTGMGTGVTPLSSWTRYKLGWISPKATYTLGSAPLTVGNSVDVTLTDVLTTGDDGFIRVNPPAGSDPDQYFIIDMIDSTSTTLLGSSRCLADPVNSGLMVYHVCEKTLTESSEKYSSKWSDPTPPLIDPESARGMFADDSNEAPDPVRGVDLLSNNEGTWVRVSSGKDQLREGADEVSMVAPYTNPSTHLYWSDANDEVYYSEENAARRKEQTEPSGLTVHDVHWDTEPGSGGAGNGQVGFTLYYDGVTVGSDGHGIDDGMTWSGRVRLVADVDVASNTLTVASGTTIDCAAAQDVDKTGGDPGRVEIHVGAGGLLDLDGAVGNEVTFTSSRDNTITHSIDVDGNGDPIVVAGEAADPAAGDWVGVKFLSDTGLDASETDIWYAAGALNFSTSVFPDLSSHAGPSGIEFHNNDLDVTFDRDINVTSTDVEVPAGCDVGLLPGDAGSSGKDPSRVEIILDAGGGKLTVGGEILSGAASPQSGDWYGVRTDDLSRIVGDGGTVGHGMAVVAWEGTALPALSTTSLKSELTFASSNISDVSLRRDYTLPSGTYEVPSSWVVGFVDNEDDGNGGRDDTRAELFVPSGAILQLSSGSVLRSASPSAKRGAWYGVRTEALTRISATSATIMHAGGAVSLEGVAAGSMPSLAAPPFTNLTLSGNASDVCFDRDLTVAQGATLEIDDGWRIGFATNYDGSSDGFNTGLSELIVRGELKIGDLAGDQAAIVSNLHEDLAADSVAWEGIHFLGEWTTAPGSYGWALATDSYIENTEIASAAHHVSVDTLCAPALHDVVFVGGGETVGSSKGHIFLNGTDVVVPSDGWTLSAGTFVVASSSTPGGGYDYGYWVGESSVGENDGPREIGEEQKVDLVIQGPLVVNGLVNDRVRFRSEESDGTHPNKWAGMFFDMFSGGSSVYGAQIRYAPIPVFFYEPTYGGASTIRQSVIRNFTDVGVWIEGGTSVVEIDSCSVIRGPTSSVYGTTGILTQNTSRALITDNAVQMTLFLGSSGGEGIRVAGAKVFCSQSSSAVHTLEVSGNVVTGQARTLSNVNWVGLELDNMCAVNNNVLVVEGNRLEEWSQAGLVSTSSGDAEIECNEIVENRRALESWGAGPVGSSANTYDENLLMTYYEGVDIEVIESDDFSSVDLGSDNTIAIAVRPADTGSGFFVANHNSSDSSTLNGSGNTWWEIDMNDPDTVLEAFDNESDIEDRCDLESSSLSVSSTQEDCQSCDCPGNVGTGEVRTLPMGPVAAGLDDVGPLHRVVGREIPLKTGVYRLGPNPSRGVVQVEFGVAADAVGLFRADVYDVAGRLVRHLAQAWAEPGFYHVSWDGRSNSRGRVASGVYFVRLSVGEEIEVRKIVRLQ